MTPFVTGALIQNKKSETMHNSLAGAHITGAHDIK